MTVEQDHPGLRGPQETLFEQELDREQTAGEREYERRWWTLGVLCLSLVMIVVANATLNVALPTLVKDLHAGVELAAVDRRRLQPRVRRAAAHRRLARRPVRPAARAERRPGHLRCRVAVRRVRELVERADRRPRRDGRRRRVRDAGDAVGPRPRVPARGAAAGDRDLGRLRRASAPRSAASTAVGCSSTSGGDRSSSPTSSSSSVALIAGFFLIPSRRRPRAARPVGALLSIAGLGALVYAIIEAPDHGWLSDADAA